MPTSKIATLILAATVCVACGGSSTPSSSSGSSPSAPASAHSSLNGACTYLTNAQVSTALGEPAGDGKQTQIFDTTECEWQPASGHNGTVTLDVGIWNGNPGVQPVHNGTPVPSVGDEAYSDNTGLYVRKGQNGFRIWVFNVSSQSTRLDLEQSLASILLPKF